MKGTNYDNLHVIFTNLTTSLRYKYCPSLTHIDLCSAIWWPRVRYISQTEFIKLQKLACLAITGVMMTAPTAAMEVPLGLLHLHVMPGVGPGRMYRIKCTKQWKPISTNFGHTKKSWNLEHKLS